MITGSSTSLLSDKSKFNYFSIWRFSCHYATRPISRGQSSHQSQPLSMHRLPSFDPMHALPPSPPNPQSRRRLQEVECLRGAFGSKESTVYTNLHPGTCLHVLAAELLLEHMVTNHRTGFRARVGLNTHTTTVKILSNTIRPLWPI